MSTEARLIEQGPDGRVWSHSLGKTTVIGRGAHCDVRLDDEAVSTDHAEIVCHGETFLLTDLGSVNGTVVNGKLVAGPLRLRNADAIQIGAHRFEVQLPSRSATKRDEATGVRLSDDERELAAALAAPFREVNTFAPRPPSRRELAEQLNLSESTVRRRLDSLAHKLRIPADAGRDRPRLVADQVIALGLDRG